MGWAGSWWSSHADGKMHCTDYSTRRPPGAPAGSPLSYLCGAPHMGNDGVLAVTMSGIPMAADGSKDPNACATCVRLDAELREANDGR